MGLYRVLFYGGLALAIMFLIVTVVLFFVLKIPKVFGDLTGHTQRKSIEAIQKTGYEAKSKQDAIKAETSRITVRDAVDTTSDGLKHRTKNLRKKSSAVDEESTEVLGYTGAKGNDDKTDVLGYDTGDGKTDVLGYDNGNDVTTDVLSSEDDEKTDVLAAVSEEPTDVLADSEKTDVLTSESVTDVLSQASDKYRDNTIIGNYSPEETGVLRSMDAPVSDVNKSGRKISVVYEVKIVHTNENI